jgi:hypothetical protein
MCTFVTSISASLTLNSNLRIESRNRTEKIKKRGKRCLYFFFILYLCLFDARGNYPPPGSNARTSATVKVGCCVAVTAGFDV